MLLRRGLERQQRSSLWQWWREERKGWISRASLLKTQASLLSRLCRKQVQTNPQSRQLGRRQSNRIPVQRRLPETRQLVRLTRQRHTQLWRRQQPGPLLLLPPLHQ
jgi:hypothetical protein